MKRFSLIPLLVAGLNAAEPYHTLFNDASDWNDEVMTASWFTEQPEGHSEWYADHFRQGCRARRRKQ